MCGIQPLILDPRCCPDSPGGVANQLKAQMWFGCSLLVYLQVADDAEGFWSVQTAGGGGRQLMSSSNKKVSCGWVTTALGADVTEFRYDDVIRDPAFLGPCTHLQS